MSEKVELILFLINNIDIFSWSPYEVPAVDPDFICHRLNVDLVVHQRNKVHVDPRIYMLR